jgi:RHH-type rel operon transcriptional repressor/antitoxin RelB
LKTLVTSVTSVTLENGTDADAMKQNQTTEKTQTSVVRISRALDERLDALAAKTGRRKSFYASKAIERYLEDLEDYYAAKEAYERSKKRYTLAEAAKKLGLDY